MTTLATRNRILMPSLALVLTALIAVPALVNSSESAYANGDPARSAVGSDLVIAKGESVAGDVSVTSGNLSLNGEVTGNAIVVNGNADIAGTISGNLYVVGGSVTIRSTGSVGGEVDYTGGMLVKEPGSIIKGQVLHDGLPGFGLADSVTNSVSGSSDSAAHSWLTPFGQIGMLFGWGLVSLVMLAISVVLAVVAPLRLRIASATLVSEGRPSVMLGLIIAALLAPLTAGIIALLMVTVIGWVLIPVVAAFVVTAIAAGLAIMGVWLGRRIYQTAHQEPGARPTPMLVQMLLGMATILCSTILPAALVPVGGVAFTLLLLLYVAGCIGLGSIVLSRLGTLPPARRRSNDSQSAAHGHANTMPLGSFPPGTGDN